MVTNFWLGESLKYEGFSRFFLLVLRIPTYLTFFVSNIFLRYNYHSGYTVWKFYIRIRGILILKNKASLIGFVCLKVLLQNLIFCLKVYDGNLRDTLTQKLAALRIMSLFLWSFEAATCFVHFQWEWLLCFFYFFSIVKILLSLQYLTISKNKLVNLRWK